MCPIMGFFLELAKPITAMRGYSVDWAARMIDVNSLKTFDAADYLETDEDVAIFLDEAFQSDNARHVITALKAALHAKVRFGKLEYAPNERAPFIFECEDMSLSRLMEVLQTLGCQFNVAVKEHS